MRKAAEPLSWDPVAKGSTYCAPACGRGCTKAEHTAAMKLAAEVASALGPDWKPDVWENLGWHSRAVSPRGHIKVHPNGHHLGEVSYTAFLGRFAEHGRTPREAVDKVCHAMLEYV